MIVPNAAIFLQSAVGIARLYVLTLYFQVVLGHGPLAAGLLFLPMTLSAVVAAPAAGRLDTRFGTRATGAAGLLIVVAGLLLMTAMAEGSGLALVVAGSVIGEAGFMLSNVSLTIAGSGAAGEENGGSRPACSIPRSNSATPGASAWSQPSSPRWPPAPVRSSKA